MKFRFQYIYAVFILSFTVLTILSINFYNRLTVYNRFSTEVEHNYEVMYLLSQVDGRFKEAVAAERGYILTRDSSFLELFAQNNILINPLIDSIRTLSSQNNLQGVNLNNLKRIISERMQQIKMNFSKAARGEIESFDLRMLQSKVSMREYYQVMQKLEEEEKRLLNIRNEQKKSYQRSTTPLLFSIFMFATIIFVVSFFFIIRELRKRLNFQQQLQQQVGELNRANAELEQLTNAASHHLQEPLRKIRTFTNRLVSHHGNGIPEEMKMLLQKIDQSAAHMHGLTNDMVKYSNLITAREKPEAIDLNYIIMKVAEQMDERLTVSGGQVVVSNSLPVVNGIPLQLAILFEQLIDNSLKFCRKDIPCLITITNEGTIGKKISDKIFAVFGGTLYYRVSVSDNGMGFSNEFAEKIFQMFQKLDPQPVFFQSRGIGLAMVQRIMINHGGNVTATGEAGNGAVFYLYFPVPNR